MHWRYCNFAQSHWYKDAVFPKQQFPLSIIIFIMGTRYPYKIFLNIPDHARCEFPQLHQTLHLKTKHSRLSLWFLAYCDPNHNELVTELISSRSWSVSNWYQYKFLIVHRTRPNKTSVIKLSNLPRNSTPIFNNSQVQAGKKITEIPPKLDLPTHPFIHPTLTLPPATI